MSGTLRKEEAHGEESEFAQNAEAQLCATFNEAQKVRTG